MNLTLFRSNMSENEEELDKETVGRQVRMKEFIWSLSFFSSGSRKTSRWHTRGIQRNIFLLWQVTCPCSPSLTSWPVLTLHLWHHDLSSLSITDIMTCPHSPSLTSWPVLTLQHWHHDLSSLSITDIMICHHFASLT